MMSEQKITDREDVRKLVRKRYGEAALRVLNDQSTTCCGSEGTGSCCSNVEDLIASNLYSDTEAGLIPEAALLASLGCGNPTALAQLSVGEVVLDLGSGGGIDVLLSARRVGETGFAYGLDMTDEMLALAEKNRLESGAANVKFLKGHIEEIPLPDGSVDVIISNCVINLSADKDQVLREAFRVLKPGGRFAVSDVVVDGALPDLLRKDMEAYVGCVAGALERTEYLDKLSAAGFVNAHIEPTRRYRFTDIESTSLGSELLSQLSEDEKRDLDGKVMGAFIRADKAAASSRIVEVFDPALCCSTGVCGASVDPILVRAARDLDWLKRQPGIAVERFNLSQQPHAFVANPTVRKELESSPERLPLVLIDGNVVARGEYPSREQFCEMLGIPAPAHATDLNVVNP